MSFFKNLTASSLFIASLVVGLFFVSNIQKVNADSVTSSTTVYVAPNPICTYGTLGTCNNVCPSTSGTQTNSSSTGDATSCPVLNPSCTGTCNAGDYCPISTQIKVRQSDGTYVCQNATYNDEVTVCSMVTLWGGNGCESAAGRISASDCLRPFW